MHSYPHVLIQCTYLKKKKQDENEKSQNILWTPQCLMQVLLVIRFGSSLPELSGFLHLAVESVSVLVVFPVAQAVFVHAVAV